MQVNKKKNLTIKNRTVYFKPDTVRTHITISSPYSYQSRKVKIEGYETRLYWQYRYCESVNGQTFFYTLTYNDAHIPRHYGMNCFDYEDLRDLLTGGFYQKLRRKYGTKFKYFIGAELGDGKGERGMHNNPHYHILFFLEPDNNPLCDYVKITPEDFRHLVREYWQGFDEDVDGYRDYNEAKYGICKEGENTGLVTDYRACMYCAKYVCKDVKLKKNESELIRQQTFKYKKEFKYDTGFHNDFFHGFIYDRYNKRFSLDRSWFKYSDIELLKMLLPEEFDLVDVDLVDLDDLTPYVIKICRKFHLWKDYYSSYREFIDSKVKLDINEYRNRYCNKCRISNGVGLYGLSQIEDKLEPTIQVPSKDGFKNRPIPMYFYRKLYMDKHRDRKGRYVYVLNDLGIEYKLHNLPKQIIKKAEKLKSKVYYLITNPDLYDKMRNSDSNTKNFLTYTEFLRIYNYLLENNDLEQIYIKYAEYKLVYENRFFPYESNGFDSVVDFPDIDIDRDYHKFLIPSYFSVHRLTTRLDTFIKSNFAGYLPYSQHPYFLPYLGIFGVFDMCSDYFFIQMDNKSQKEAEEIAATKRFHDKERLKEFYNFFK